jgi:hypothetical protein
MATYVPAKRATQYIVYVGLPSAANGSIYQASATLAAGDAKVSIDGGALANLATLPAVTPAASKMVKVTLSTSEMTGDNITVILSDQTSPPEWADVILNIPTVASQIDDLPTAAGIADAVWDEDATGHQTQGTFGQAIGDPAADTNTIYKAVVSDATGATVGVDVVAVKAETAIIVVDTTTDIPALIDALPTAAENATAVMASNVEGTVTLTESMRLQNAVLLGKASGLATTTAVYRDLADTKDRVSATVDADGNRSAVTLDDS